MGKRLNRTLFNWRWWVMLPAVLPLLPVVAIDLLLALVIVCAELASRAAEDTRNFLKSLCGPVLAAMRKWALKKEAP